MVAKTSKNPPQQQPPTILRSKELEWVNLDLSQSNDVAWLERASGLSKHIVKLFLDQRQTIVQLQHREGTFLRVLYAKLGRDPSKDQIDDLGFWIEARRVVTFRQGAPGSLIEGLEAEVGGDSAPGTPWGFFASAASHLASYVERNLVSLESTVDRLEDSVIQRGARLPIDELAALRRRFIYMRRYKAPLAGLLESIACDADLDMDEEARSEVKEAAASLTQSQQLSEFFNERASNVHEHIQNRLSERMDKVAFRMTLVATVFLPSTFLTGLLGINVAGIPGTHDPYAFWLVCFFLVLVAVISTVIVARVTKS